MPIVGGLDIHRRQITFDYLDTVTGEVKRGQIAPADRAHVRAWLARFAGRDDAAFAVEGCAGWRYVSEELATAGIAAHLGEPADTAALRGRKRHAKTDKTDAAAPADAAGRGPAARMLDPPAHILEYRALLETYHDLRTAHTAWVQRIHAVFFHQGAPPLMRGTRCAPRPGLAKLRAAAAAHLSAAGQQQVATALDMIAATEARMGPLRHQLRDAAAHLTGAKVLAARLYGVGPFTALALTCWLGGADRFSSSRKAVRFTGLDITVHSSDRKGPAGRLSRQGPPVLRWAVYEAGKTHARTSAPDHAYYATVKDRKNSKRACPVGGPQDRPAGLPHPDRARRRRAHRRLSFAQSIVTRHPASRAWAGSAATLTRWGPPRPAPAEPLSAAAGLRAHQWPGGRPD